MGVSTRGPHGCVGASADRHKCCRTCGGVRLSQDQERRSQILARWQGGRILTEGWAVCLSGGSRTGVMETGPAEHGVGGHGVAESPRAGLSGEHG